MLSHLALVTHQVLVAAEAVPVGPSHSGILSVVRLAQLGQNFGHLFLQVAHLLLHVLVVGFAPHEEVNLVGLVPDVGNLLVHAAGCLHFLFQVTNQSHQIRPLVVQLVVGVSLKVLNGLAVDLRHLCSTLSCFLLSISALLLISQQRLVELHVLSQVLQALLDLLNARNRNVVLALNLSCCLFCLLFELGHSLIQPLCLNISLDEHILQLLHIFLVLCSQLALNPFQLSKLSSHFLLKTLELTVSYSFSQGTLQLDYYIV